MKTLGVFLGSMIVAAIIAVGAAFIVVGLSYAQEESVLPVANQLLQRHDVSEIITDDDDDLYAVLKGTADSLLVERSLIDSVRGPQRAYSSSIIDRQEIAPVNQPSGTDLYGAATDYLGEIVNPDSYNLLYVKFVGVDTLIFGFGIGEGAVDVCVNILTAEASMDEVVVEHSLNLRADIAGKMQVDIADVHINGIEGIEGFEAIHLYDWYFTMTARVGDYTLSFVNWERGWEMPTIEGPGEGPGRQYGKPVLTSLINNATGVDLYKNAVDELMAVVNPDTYTLDSWQMGEDGNLAFNFKLQDGSIIGIRVNPQTGETWMQNGDLQKSVLNARYDIARRMGMDDIGDVHINSVEIMHLDYYYDYGYWPWPLQSTTYIKITARVGDYSLSLSGTIYKWLEYYDFEDLSRTIQNFEYPGYTRVFGLRLDSFVDTRTGVDYVNQAITEIQGLFNPDFYGIGVVDWHMENGALHLAIDLHGLNQNPFYFYIGSPISLDIDLATGQIRVDPVVVDAVTRARNEISEKLNVVMDNVHVNSIWVMTKPNGPYIDEYGYSLILSTPQFSITYNYELENRALHLVSLIDCATGIDLYRTAIDHLIEVINPSSYVIDCWGVSDDGLFIGFTLPDGSSIYMRVDAAGFAYMKLSEATLIEVRRQISDSMSLSKENVHIDGLEINVAYNTRINLINEVYYNVTAKAGDFTITMDCLFRDGWISMDRIGEITLTSLVNNNTGIDLYASAVNYMSDTYGENGSLIDWSISEGHFTFNFRLADGSIIKLGVDIESGQVWEKDPDLYGDAVRYLVQIVNPESYELRYVMFMGEDTVIFGFGVGIGTVDICIDISTLEPSMDDSLKDALLTVRAEVGNRLGVNAADVKISEAMLLHRIPENPAAYLIKAVSGSLEITMIAELSDNTGMTTTRLAAVINRVTGVDLYAKAVNMLSGIPGEYMLNSWGVKDGTIEFAFISEDGSIVRIVFDIDTASLIDARRIRTIEYDDQGRLRSQEITAYDENGSVIHRELLENLFFNNQGYVTVMRVTDYNQDGSVASIKLIENTKMDADGNVLHRKEWCYDADGVLISLTERTYPGPHEEPATITTVIYEPDGSIAVVVVSDNRIYDAEGRLVSEIVTTYMADGSITGISVHEGKVYDDDNRLVSETVTRYSGTGEFIERNFIENLAFDDQGNVIYGRITTYDEDGNITSIKEIYTVYDDMGRIATEVLYGDVESPRVESIQVQQQSQGDQNDEPADAPQSGSGNNQDMPDWIKQLLEEILSKNTATSRGGGSKNVHTYDQMAGADNSGGLALRWKR